MCIYLPCAEDVHGAFLGGHEADLDHLVFFSTGHKFDFVLGAEFTVHDAEVDDDATVGIVVGVEDEGFEGAACLCVCVCVCMSE